MSCHALSAASPFFQSMFDLPQSPDTHTHRGEFIYHDLPAVPMSERADVLGPVLRCCHAREDAGVSSTGLLASMLEVADKYDMLGAVLGAIERSAQGGSVRRLVERDPATIYALAYHHHLPDLARASVRSLLRLDVGTIDASKDEPLVQGYLTPHARKCLKEYHRACSRAVGHVLRYPVWAPCERESRLWLDEPDRYVWWTCASCPVTGDASWSRFRKREPRAWFTQYLADMSVTLEERPLDIGDNAAFRSAVRAASKCGTCAEHAYEHLTEFAALLQERVDMAISRIQLELF
ncbi:hypothetical protein PUNSTDRAFT_55946 [Punctularia strigosozonata HHB-11173 SS5]|uniref:BTB domain-containing protein n=1 Tax=Punctularia strigosozonata (strain HHB-11173) TaxID=741275 RepID=R7S259_PUNST|nr:uncharacterized protein PUNSTDRAFT_55946 [Punctularia strigosozonata HHB-11173 SS5]EIN03867.1 hypothetical protein PUNSTDRAFT_55946 [Punctularia strigosozonata HHB-11173 SS5]